MAALGQKRTRAVHMLMSAMGQKRTSPPAYAGTDFIIARDGKIAVIYLFFDELP
jgi:hypothetical protein